MGLESQPVINPHHKSRPIKVDHPSIAWIKFITHSSSFGPRLECLALKSAQISWISPLSASLIFLDLALVIGPTGTCNGSLNTLWFSSVSDLGFRWWKKAWVACRSYRDSTRRSGEKMALKKKKKSTKPPQFFHFTTFNNKGIILIYSLFFHYFFMNSLFFHFFHPLYQPHIM